MLTKNSDTSQYIRCYKYLPFNPGSLCILTEGTIKFTNPLEFNDPFDCYPTWDKKAIKRTTQRNRRAYRHGLDQKIDRQAGKQVSPAKRVLKRSQFSRSAERLVGTHEWREQILTSVGVVSLSASPTNIVMWSHYACNHRGFVVGFKVPLMGLDEDIENYPFNLVCHPVEYSSQRPVIEMGDNTDDEHVQKLLMTKSEGWAYEEEHRVVDVTRGAGIHTFNRERVLECVIAGMAMPESDFKTLSQAVAETAEDPELSGLRLYKAQISEKDYAIEIPKFPF